MWGATPCEWLSWMAAFLSWRAGSDRPSAARVWAPPACVYRAPCRPWHLWIRSDRLQSRLRAHLCVQTEDTVRRLARALSRAAQDQKTSHAECPSSHRAASRAISKPGRRAVRDRWPAWRPCSSPRPALQRPLDARMAYGAFAQTLAGGCGEHGVTQHTFWAIVPRVDTTATPAAVGVVTAITCKTGGPDPVLEEDF